MPLDTLVAIVQKTWDFPTSPTQHKISPTELTEMLRTRRIRGAERAYAALNTGEQIGYTLEVNPTTGEVSFSFIDMTGTRTEFGREYVYQIWPDPPLVYVGTTPQPAGTFTWRPHSMSLEFAAPVVPATARVWAKGWIVDMNAVFADVGDMLATAYSQLSNIKGDEFDELASRTIKRANFYRTRIVKRFNR